MCLHIPSVPCSDIQGHLQNRVELILLHLLSNSCTDSQWTTNTCAALNSFPAFLITAPPIHAAVETLSDKVPLPSSGPGGSTEPRLSRADTLSLKQLQSWQYGGRQKTARAPVPQWWPSKKVHTLIIYTAEIVLVSIFCKIGLFPFVLISVGHLFSFPSSKKTSFRSSLIPENLLICFPLTVKTKVRLLTMV